MAIGGYSSFNAVEFWSPFEGSCVLRDYPRRMEHGPTANFVAGKLVACYDRSCDIYEQGAWSKLLNTRSKRLYHTSAQHENRILLIGGEYSRSTEWIPLDGSPSQPRPFQVRHGRMRCALQVSSDVIVVTGGYNTKDHVTEYQLTGNARERVMTPLVTGRYDHACGVYREAGGQQVRFD